MIIGVPKEIKLQEHRIGLTPDSVKDLTDKKHKILVQENGGFEASPERTPGTYSKYNSIDDKIDDFHYYTTYIKFGIGRATYDASQEIRNNHITREEGIALVKRFDGEFPDRYFNEIMEYLDINPDYFKKELTDKFRSPHIWGKDSKGDWKLRHNVYGEGLDD